MAKLNQIVAIEKGVKADAVRKESDAYHALQKTQLFGGIARTYRSKDDAGDQLPPEGTLVQLKADEVLHQVGQDLTRLFDVVLTKEYANTTASADIVLPDGTTVLHRVPVTYLLFLEKQLIGLRAMIGKVPTLDPSEKWEYDPAAGVYATEVKSTTRTKKVPKAFVKAAATDKHPAQVEVFTEDVIEGFWDTTKFSGALPVDRVTELLARVDDLSMAVKFAREAANSTEVVDSKAGAAVFGYLFA